METHTSEKIAAPTVLKSVGDAMKAAEPQQDLRALPFFTRLRMLQTNFGPVKPEGHVETKQWTSSYQTDDQVKNYLRHWCARLGIAVLPSFQIGTVEQVQVESYDANLYKLWKAASEKRDKKEALDDWEGQLLGMGRSAYIRPSIVERATVTISVALVDELDPEARAYTLFGTGEGESVVIAKSKGLRETLSYFLLAADGKAWVQPEYPTKANPELDKLKRQVWALALETHCPTDEEGTITPALLADHFKVAEDELQDKAVLRAIISAGSVQ